MVAEIGNDVILRTNVWAAIIAALPVLIAAFYNMRTKVLGKKLPKKFLYKDYTEICHDILKRE